MSVRVNGAQKNIKRNIRVICYNEPKTNNGAIWEFKLRLEYYAKTNLEKITHSYKAIIIAMILPGSNDTVQLKTMVCLL